MNQYDNYLPLFIEESYELINKFEQGIMLLEKGNYDEQKVNLVLRLVHSLKGSSAMMGLTIITQLSHSMESLLSGIREKQIPIDEGIMGILYKCIDRLKSLHNELKQDHRLTKAATDILDEIAEILKQVNGGSAYNQTSKDTQVVLKENREQPDAAISYNKDTTNRNNSIDGSRLDIETATIRVEVAKLDKLMNLVSELIVHNESLNQLGKKLKKEFRGNLLVNNLNDLIPDINFVSSEFKEIVMSTRMQPLETIFNRFPRMIRDLAKKCDKNINFTIYGEKTEIDREIIEELINPLTHILRNSVDHGIEQEKERIATGKLSEGKISLSAKHENGYALIQVIDDGKGIDVKLIRKTIVSKGLVTAEEAEKMNYERLLRFIFEPGFSTASQVTEISGRGVGLDIVKASINKLNGLIDIKSEPAKGTCFTIRIPLTLAIIEGIFVKEQNNAFVIPIHSIVETIRLKKEEIAGKFDSTNGEETFYWKGVSIPVMHLGRFFELGSGLTNEKCYVIILGYLDKRIALVVEKILNQQQVVIKSLKKYSGTESLLGKLNGISGVSILGDGNIAQIIEVSELFHSFEQNDRRVL